MSENGKVFLSDIGISKILSILNSTIPCIWMPYLARFLNSIYKQDLQF